MIGSLLHNCDFLDAELGRGGTPGPEMRDGPAVLDAWLGFDDGDESARTRAGLLSLRVLGHDFHHGGEISNILEMHGLAGPDE